MKDGRRVNLRIICLQERDKGHPLARDIIVMKEKVLVRRYVSRKSLHKGSSLLVSGDIDYLLN